MKIRVVVVDDHELVRAGVVMLLGAMPNVEVVGQASDAPSLLALVKTVAADLVLLDIAMPGLNGLELMPELMAVLPQVKVIILSMHKDKQYVRKALSLGAQGYLLKDAAPAELGNAIAAVMRGENYLSPVVSQSALSDYVQHLRSETKADPTLTPRQIEILRLIAMGQSSKEIANSLNLSVKTVDSHRTNLMQLLGIHEITGLVRYALRNGLLPKEY
jgi:DNA-binding NarL/FixJ family response regulator